MVDLETPQGQLAAARFFIRERSRSIDWSDAAAAIKEQRMVKRAVSYFSILERLSTEERVIRVSTALCAHKAILNLPRN